MPRLANTHPLRFRLALAITLFLALATAGSACTAGTFTEVPSLGGTAPTSISGHTLSAHSANGLLYVFGGRDENYTSGVVTYYDALSSFDTAAQTWATLSSGTGPSARAYHAAVVSTAGATPKLLVVGGIFTTPSSVSLKRELWSWDIQSGGWTRLADPPTAVYSAGFVYQDGKAYLFGGVYNALYSLSNRLSAYDVATNTWTTLTAQGAAGSPPTRQNPHTFVAGGKIYVHGGTRWLAGGPIPPAPVPLNDTWMFDPATGAWTNITPSPANNVLPAPAYPSYAASGSSVVLYGGDTGAGVNGITGCGAPYPQQVSDATWVGTVSGSAVVYAEQSPAASPPALTQAAGAALGGCFYLFGGFGFPSCPPGQVWNNKVYAYGI